jgi:hypothetical protein
MSLPDGRPSAIERVETGFRSERDIEHAGLPHVLYRRNR